MNEIREFLQRAETSLAVVRSLLAPDEEQQPAPLVRGTDWCTAMLSLEDSAPAGAWGMSNETAQRLLGMQGGINASRRIVNLNYPMLRPGWMETLERVAAELTLPKHLLFAISCRASAHGSLLDENGESDHGNRFGAMGVDNRFWQADGRPNPCHYAHARQAGQILYHNLAEVRQKHPGWPDKYVLKGAVVAARNGLRSVRTIETMDDGTEEGDYGADVLARAKWYWKIENE